MTWGTTEYEIKKEVVEQLAPVQYEHFTEALDAAGICFDSFAKYKQNLDEYYVEDDLCDKFPEVEDFEDEATPEAKNALSEVNDSFSALEEHLMEEHYVRLGLFAPLAEVESGEDRGYFVVDNALVWNKAIDDEIISGLEFVDVIQGG